MPMKGCFNLKVLIYSQNQKQMRKSGIGNALRHQKEALEANGIEVTFNPKDNFDICHINTLFYRSYRFMKKLQKKGIPVVAHGHSTKEDFLNSFKFSNIIAPWFNHNLMRMYKNANYIITPTTYSKGLIENYKVKAKIFALSNGINLEKYHLDTKYDDADVENFYKFLGLKKDDKFIIGMGFYFMRKGLQDFIEVARSFPDIKFIWFGQRYKFITSRPIMKAIKNKPSNVILPGYINMNYKKVAFAKASLFFFPSYEETEGIVTLEALASKLPLLVRDIPVYNGWLEKDVNCHMASSNEGFIKEINSILNNNQEKIINEGYKVVEARDIKLIGKELKSIYEEVISNPRNE